MSIFENCGDIMFTPVLTGIERPTLVDIVYKDQAIMIFPMPFFDNKHIDLMV